MRAGGIWLLAGSMGLATVLHPPATPEEAVIDEDGLNWRSAQLLVNPVSEFHNLSSRETRRLLRSTPPSGCG
jgi:hypothetical protein